MSRYADVAYGRKHFPKISDKWVKYIVGHYGIDVTLRKRTPVVSNPTVCPCIANDDIFNQIDPNCPLCGGTGILGGEQFRDYSIRAAIQPLNEMGFFGSGDLYQTVGKFERVWQTAYVDASVPVDIGDFIIDSYTKPTNEAVTIEFEVFDKEAWWIGQGPTRGRTVVFYKLQIRKTEYPKTTDVTETY